MIDKRREANAALQESEERLRGLSEATFEGVAISESGKILETNRAFTEMFGHGRREVVGMNVLDFLAPESHEVARQSLGGTSAEPYEAVGLKSDGTRFAVEIRNKTSRYRDHLVHVTAVRDVTERKKAEERLRQAEARYRTVVEQIPAITYLQEVEHDGGTYFVSPQIEDILGYTPEEYISDPELWVEILHPDDRERVLAEDARTNRTGEPFVTEYRQFAKDGSVVWFRNEAVLVRDEEGQPLFWQGVKVNVTERKEVEQAVRENERRFRQLFDQSVDALMIHDAAGKIVDCNAEACRSLGYSRDELLSLRVRDIATGLVDSDEGRTSAEPTLWQRALVGEPGTVAGIHRGEHRRKDGTTFPVEVYVGSVDYGGGASDLRLGPRHNGAREGRRGSPSERGALPARRRGNERGDLGPRPRDERAVVGRGGRGHVRLLSGGGRRRRGVVGGARTPRGQRTGDSEHRSRFARRPEYVVRRVPFPARRRDLRDRRGPGAGVARRRGRAVAHGRVHDGRHRAPPGGGRAQRERGAVSHPRRDPPGGDRLHRPGGRGDRLLQRGVRRDPRPHAGRARRKIPFRVSR